MKCVLISGATGAIGSALVPLLLAEQDTQLKLVVRADSPEHLQQRIESLRSFWRAGGPADFKGRLEAFRGDVTRPRWGLSSDDYGRVTSQTTHIIHSAGNVRLNQPLSDARRSAVDSAQFALDIARDCQTKGQFRKLDVVSTVGVAGRTKGLIPEQPMDGAERGFHNSYEAAKAEAESIVRAAMPSLPITIHRPSMVVGDSKSGQIIRFQVFYYLSDFLAGLRTQGLVPSTGDAKLDLVPVDYVARAIQVAGDCPEACGRILHLCSGPDEACHLQDLTARLRSMLSERVERLPRLRQIPLADFRQSLDALTPLASPQNRRFLRTLPFFLDYLADEQLFDNRLTRQLLAASGIRLPRVDEYLYPVMQAYWNNSAPSSN